MEKYFFKVKVDGEIRSLHETTLTLNNMKYIHVTNSFFTSNYNVGGESYREGLPFEALLKIK